MEELFDLLEESEESMDGVVRVADAPWPATVPAEKSGAPGDVAEKLLGMGELQLPGGDPVSAAHWAGSAAARPAVQPALGLYEKVNSPRLRDGGRAGGNVVVRVSEPALPSPTGERGLEARELDRIFQRDARRYDGGLSLP